MISMMHFKFCHDGTWHRFALPTRGCKMLKCLKKRVHSVLGVEEQKMWWDDGETVNRLDDSTDLETAVAFAEQDALFTAAVPCVYIQFDSTPQRAIAEEVPVPQQLLSATADERGTPSAPTADALPTAAVASLDSTAPSAAPADAQEYVVVRNFSGSLIQVPAVAATADGTLDAGALYQYLRNAGPRFVVLDPPCEIEQQQVESPAIAQPPNLEDALSVIHTDNVEAPADAQEHVYVRNCDGSLIRVPLDDSMRDVVAGYAALEAQASSPKIAASLRAQAPILEAGAGPVEVAGARADSDFAREYAVAYAKGLQDHAETDDPKISARDPHEYAQIYAAGYASGWLYQQQLKAASAAEANGAPTVEAVAIRDEVASSRQEDAATSEAPVLEAKEDDLRHPGKYYEEEATAVSVEAPSTSPARLPANYFTSSGIRDHLTSEAEPFPTFSKAAAECRFAGNGADWRNLESALRYFGEQYPPLFIPAAHGAAPLTSVHQRQLGGPRVDWGPLLLSRALNAAQATTGGAVPSMVPDQKIVLEVAEKKEEEQKQEIEKEKNRIRKAFEFLPEKTMEREDRKKEQNEGWQINPIYQSPAAVAALPLDEKMEQLVITKSASNEEAAVDDPTAAVPATLSVYVPTPTETENFEGDEVKDDSHAEKMLERLRQKSAEIKADIDEYQEAEKEDPEVKHDSHVGQMLAWLQQKSTEAEADINKYDAKHAAIQDQEAVKQTCENVLDFYTEPEDEMLPERIWKHLTGNKRFFKALQLDRVEQAGRPDTVCNTERETEEMKNQLLITIRSLLNKITPATQDSLIAEFLEHKVYESPALNEVISLIFDKAVETPQFCSFYASLCNTQVNEELKQSIDNISHFRNALLVRAQEALTRKDEEEKIAEMQSAIDAETNAFKKSEKQIELIETNNQFRMSKFGSIMLIGHLYLQGLISVRLIHFAVYDLLKSVSEMPANVAGYKADDEAVGCAVSLLETIGQRLEEESAASEAAARQQVQPLLHRPVTQRNPFPVDKVFYKLQEAMSIVSSGVRSSIVNLVELRANQWMPRASVATGYQFKSENIKTMLTARRSRMQEYMEERAQEERDRERKAQREMGQREERELLEKLRSFLYEFNCKNKDRLIAEFLEYRVHESSGLMAVINLIFDQSVKRPELNALYASLCAAQVAEELQLNANNNVSKFRNILLLRAQQTFDTKRKYDFEMKKQAEINAATDEEEQLQRDIELIEGLFEFRRNKFGNISFLGHLYLHEIMSSRIIVSSIVDLLYSVKDLSENGRKRGPDEEAIECAVRLLHSCGRRLHEEAARGINNVATNGGRPTAFPFETTFATLEAAEQVVSEKLRRMIEKLVVLRANGWEENEDDVQEEKDDNKGEDEAVEALVTPLVPETTLETAPAAAPIAPPGSEAHGRRPVRERGKPRGFNYPRPVINLIFDQSVKRPELNALYASLCAAQVAEELQLNANNNVSKFRNILLLRAQQTFDTKRKYDFEMKKQAEINAATDEEEQLQRDIELIEGLFEFRRNKFGNISFLGHLYLHEIMSSRIIVSSIVDLLYSVKDLSENGRKRGPDEEAIECAVRLLHSCGRRLHEEAARGINNVATNGGRPTAFPFETTFATLEAAEQVVSEKLRRMIEKLVVLRANGWEENEDDVQEEKDDNKGEDEAVEALVTPLVPETTLETAPAAAPIAPPGSEAHGRRPVRERGKPRGFNYPRPHMMTTVSAGYQALAMSQPSDSARWPLSPHIVTLKQRVILSQKNHESKRNELQEHATEANKQHETQEPPLDKVNVAVIDEKMSKGIAKSVNEGIALLVDAETKKQEDENIDEKKDKDITKEGALHGGARLPYSDDEGDATSFNSSSSSSSSWTNIDQLSDDSMRM